MTAETSLFTYLISNLDKILTQTVNHIGITAVSLVIAMMIGIPVGLLLTRQQRSSPIILGGIGVIQTIPSIALLGFLLPFFGIGVVPAIVALFLYSLYPIVRNTYTGIMEVNDDVIEAAKGMGMTSRQIMRKVELPLAAPIIFAGIRTASVLCIGIATLTSIIGAGGLGKFIFEGIQLNNPQKIMAGAIPAAILALVFDFVLAMFQRYIKHVIKPLLVIIGVAILVLIPLWIYQQFYDDTLIFGMEAEFIGRSDGYPGLSQHYGFTMETSQMDAGLMYQALQEGEVDVISGYATDGRIKAYDLVILEDDRHFFPPYYVAPLVRQDTLNQYPFLQDIFAKLAGKISNETMSQMNYRVDHNHEEPGQVAKDFLDSIGLETDNENQGSVDIIIGSKGFTEQYILSHIFKLLIENYSDLNVELKTGLGGTMICFSALENGEIDLYAEYTGTGFLNILEVDEVTRDAIIRDRTKVYNYVKEQFKELYDLVWLKPLGFNNTYALMMRSEDALDLNIKSISDLKDYVHSMEEN